jgi:hypothetical protein
VVKALEMRVEKNSKDELGRILTISHIQEGKSKFGHRKLFG